MNILLCHERFLPRFGVDRVLLALAREFRRRGHRVTLLGLAIDEAAALPECADRIVRIPGPAESLSADVLTAEWLADHWEDHFAGGLRPDVVLIAGWPFFSAIPIFEARGCRVVYQDHGIIPTDGLPEIGWRTIHLIDELKRTFLREASATVAVSEFIRDSQSRARVPAARPLWVIPNAVDHVPLPARKSPALRSGPGPRILCPGRFEPGRYKQSELVFALERHVRVWAPDAWIGCFGDRAAITGAAGGDDATQVVALGEPTDAEMADLVVGCDVVVCFSRWEGYNLPLAEAQRLGRPCLVFEIGAHPEVVAHPWLMCADLEAMDAKVRALADGTAPEEIRDGTAFATWNAAQGRTWSAVAERYLTVFEEVARSEPNRTGVGGNRPAVLVDVTNAVRDPSNSGCVRVARRLGAEWQAFLEVTFVVWMREAQAFRFPTAAEFIQLGAYHGPVRSPTHPVSEDGSPLLLEPWLAGGLAHAAAERPGWMLLPEIRHRPDLWPILEFAARARLRTASIFHDAIPLVRPELVPDPAYREGHADYMRGLSRVDVSVANSRASADALREFWRVEGLSGRVTPCLLPGGLPGERPARGPSWSDGGSEAVSSGTSPFILMVSTLEPRKGHRRLIEAFLAASADGRRAAWRLVLVGGRLWWSNEIAEFVEAMARTHPQITWLEDASDDRLRQLYRDCAFTVYASEIEGFGLPIMESVWHGRPCLCHDDGVMRELAAGGGCMAADLMQPTAFAEALGRMMDDGALRDRLAAECRARSVKRWRDFAAEFWARLAWMRWAELESPQADGDENEPVAAAVAGRLSFIIPTYNRLDLLQVCLETLHATLPRGLDAEIIVIDDASGDGTRSWLERGEGAAAGLRVLRHATNRGYGASINRAARVATGERLVLLNHDLRFEPGWLEPMLEVWERRPGRFAVGNLQHAARDGSLDHAGIVFDPTGHPEHFRAEAAWLRRVASREFPAITFACALVDRRKFLALGGVDASFLNGFEDVDICLRARFRGWPSVVATASVVEHQISATPGRKLAESENRHRFFARWQPLAVVLGRDWEERLAWEQNDGAAMPPDVRSSAHVRVLIDLTPLSPSECAPVARRILRDEIHRTATGGEAPVKALLVATQTQVATATVAEWLGDELHRDEVELWCLTAGALSPGNLKGVRAVSGPAITLARRLEADVLYAPTGESDLVSPDVPVLVPRGPDATRVSPRMRAVVYRESGGVEPEAPLRDRAVAAARVFSSAGVTWRWAEAWGRLASGGGAPGGSRRPPRPPHATAGTEASADSAREEFRLPAAQFAPEAILCCVDEPVCWEEDVPLIEIRGWCVHRDGVPLTGVAVRTTTGRTWRGVMGRARPDVAAALPGVATAGASGFSVRVPASEGSFALWAFCPERAVCLRTWRAGEARPVLPV